MEVPTLLETFLFSVRDKITDLKMRSPSKITLEVDGRAVLPVFEARYPLGLKTAKCHILFKTTQKVVSLYRNFRDTFNQRKYSKRRKQVFDLIHRLKRETVMQGDDDACLWQEDQTVWGSLPTKLINFLSPLGVSLWSHKNASSIKLDEVEEMISIRWSEEGNERNHTSRVFAEHLFLELTASQGKGSKMTVSSKH